jgi:hypothetical protein
MCLAAGRWIERFCYALNQCHHAAGPVRAGRNSGVPRPISLQARLLAAGETRPKMLLEKERRSCLPPGRPRLLRRTRQRGSAVAAPTTAAVRLPLNSLGSTHLASYYPGCDDAV